MLKSRASGNFNSLDPLAQTITVTVMNNFLPTSGAGTGRRSAALHG